MPSEFTRHDLGSAPENSKPLLKQLLANSGPNGFYAVTAESPETLKAYAALHQAFMATSFTDAEKTVVWQTVNVANECHFCVPAHTSMAKAMKIDDAVSNALRDETPLPTAKLEALRDFVLLMMRNDGNVSDAQIAVFLDAGYTRRNMLEVVLGLAQKTISNYVNHLARMGPDKQYRQYAWTKAGRREDGAGRLS
jgi:AhpD family alkylhydroperoxidase